MGRRRVVLIGIGGVVALAAAGALIWLLSLPAESVARRMPPIAQDEHPTVDEHLATLASLKPPKRQRPVIAILGVNEGTEVTDYLMPYGILRRADVAEVVALGARAGTVKLFPALQVQAQATLAEFDSLHPDGADYVIVPAMHRDDDPAALAWIKSQSANGATIIGVCAGAKVVAEAGLLDGRRATTHWYYLRKMLERHPEIQYVANRRFVIDRGVATTTGISASMPMSLTLIEAIAGRDKAEAVAREIGLPGWDERHDSRFFRFTRPFARTVIGNSMAFWKRERFGIELQEGVDEVSLAILADMWSRTYRSRAVTFAAGGAAVRSRGGLMVVPDEVAGSWPPDRQVLGLDGTPPATVLREGIQSIADRYGDRTASVVAMQLEYAR